MRVVNRQVPTAFRERRRRSAAAAQRCLEFRRGGAREACRSARSASRRSFSRASWASSPRWMWCSGLAEVLPSGAYSRRRHHRAATCARSSRTPTRTNDFRLLEKRALPGGDPTSTTCERIVFGGPPWLTTVELVRDTLNHAGGFWILECRLRYGCGFTVPFCKFRRKAHGPKGRGKAAKQETLRKARAEKRRAHRLCARWLDRGVVPSSKLRSGDVVGRICG